MLKPSLIKITFLSLLLALSGCDKAPQTETKTQKDFNPQLPDFAALQDVKEKKRAFFGFLKPLIAQANEKVLIERNTIETLSKKAELDATEQETLNGLLKKYRVKATDKAQQFAELKQKVNVIPPSLVLAQAANESAWGTSRFAKQGNNLFGQWCFSKGCGLVPSSRNSGASHEVAKFDSPYRSVASYIRNLNSHPSYAELRQLRNQELSEKNYSTGMTLAAGLLKYSERGEEYVKEIRAMIRHNKLAEYDEPQVKEQPQG
ncbi:glucosaminidase domain-containing protein [Bacterioplanoides sp.]|uniref:glucosaminidase domain-containing protein n=1 Tax=Bacterioplanoides sp. TaxID=2066072 RepID=UPI003B595CC6